MSISYETIQETNKSFPKDSVPNPVGLFVGATSGVGEQTVYEFAKLTVNPDIYFVGRNAESGARVTARLKEINPAAKVNFLQHDLIYIEQAERVVNIIRNNEDKLNVISVSQGSLESHPRKETPEGLEEKMVLTYYSRWVIISMLIPLLQKAAEAGEPARVLTVHGSKQECAIDLDDLELKKTYSLTHSVRMASTYNSIACERFARKYPEISFTHSIPGLVKTQDHQDIPVWKKVWAKLTHAPAPRSATKLGECQIYIAYTGKEFAKGSHLVDENLQSIVAGDEVEGNYSEENQEKLWQHTEDMIKRAIESDLVE